MTAALAEKSYSRSYPRIGLVTAYGECGMGYIARNWIYFLEKNNIHYEIYSRSDPWLTPFRWYGKNITQGPESMDIDHEHFWNWVESFQPELLLFQDQNLNGKTGMERESHRFRQMGIKIINYPDWIMQGELERHRGIYDIEIAHVKRNYRWLKQAGIEKVAYIKWGVLIDQFPYNRRQPAGKIRFYINLGHGTQRKGYRRLPGAVKRLKGDFQVIATAVNGSQKRIPARFKRFFHRKKNCDLIFETADNAKGGLYNLGDIYVYPTTREGVGLSITEAMCTGMPVITTNFPTMNEWITDHQEGRLVRVAKEKRDNLPMPKVFVDVDHLTQCMEYYLRNPAIVAQHSENAADKIRRVFNWYDREAEFTELLII